MLTDPLKQTMFGIPVICVSEMPVLQQNNTIMALGDFKEGYKIVDRSNINIMRDPYTNKPFVKFYAVKRVGGDVINEKAIKLAVFK
ncbi:MAG: phage major capsid protein [Candidatus Rickettsia vulgarisii]